MTTNPVLQISETSEPGDDERCEMVMEAISRVCEPLLPLGTTAILDGLFSLYLSFAIQWVGVSDTEDALRRAIANLPRIAQLFELWSNKPTNGKEN